jgi:hypothetical protein
VSRRDHGTPFVAGRRAADAALVTGTASCVPALFDDGGRPTGDEGPAEPCGVLGGFLGFLGFLGGIGTPLGDAALA